MRNLLGGKGSGLAEMTGLGLPVPPGFVITTEACRVYMQARDIPENLMESVAEHLKDLESSSGKRLTDPENPLLLSVRSGAPFSMPGMMDTILDLGLNDTAVEGLAHRTGDERFAYDSYRRFIQMFGDIVLGIKYAEFEKALAGLKRERDVEKDVELSAEDFKRLVRTYEEIVERKAGTSFPQDPQKQLELSIRAVFGSWNNDRAVTYRREFGIPDDLGTAVIIQTMVFGNMGEDSATGVAFTRDPSTGKQGVFGEFLLNAQGEDVVAGIRTPQPISEMEEVMPRAYSELMEMMHRVENDYRDMQDMEFTVEHGKLYILQTRSGKRTAVAALKIARDMAEEGIISREEAVSRIEPDQLAQVLHPHIDPSAELEVLARGLPASPGAGIGKIVFAADEAAKRGEAGEEVILVRKETNPDDVHGLIQAQGVLTSLGGMTSHAAVVARGFGKPAVTGCSSLEIDPEAGKVRVKDRTFCAGDVITIDGSTGHVFGGAAPLVEPDLSEDFEQILSWADELRALDIRANADTPEDATKARQFGAQGIGLCRTEHMFMQEGRLEIVRRMILARDEGSSNQALFELKPLQRSDFEAIFKAMDGLPVTVRLLDPPLHEFLPSSRELVERIAGLQNDSPNDRSELRELLRVVDAMEESNPMLGLRGCRIGITRPEIYRMQAQTIAEAARNARAQGYTPIVEIMVPLVGYVSEFRTARKSVEAAVREVLGEDDLVHIGTMMELPRACLMASQIAQYADFFSFGTNDLTQTVCGFSRDDAEGKFLADYLERGILEVNPFETIDREGVGSLVEMAGGKGRETNSEITLGICGEHGGDPKSIHFFHEIGLDYISCSPYRVPVARLAAAHAAIKSVSQVKDY
jgi:pyruvate,orthophosphate dikinase